MMHVRPFLPLAAALVSWACGTDGVTTQPESSTLGQVALVNVAVVPMDEEGVLPKHTVLVEGDRIVAVGPVESVGVPETAMRVDGRGRYLLPGLADMHVHIPEDYSLLLYIANGVTTVRNMEGYFWHPRWREEVASGMRLGPTIITTGPILDDSAMTREEAVDEVKAEAETGYDLVKVYNGTSAEGYEGIVETGAELGVPVVGHVPFAVGLDRALSAPQSSIEHLRGYVWELVPSSAPIQPDPTTKARWLAWQYADTTKFSELAQRTVEAGVWNCPTLLDQTFFASPEAQHRARLERPETRYLSHYVRAWGDRSADPHFKDFTETDYQDLHRHALPMRQHFVRALRDAGAGLLLGSDAWVVPGYATHEELAELVRAGLTPYEAIRAGTYDAARYLGEEDEFGSVRVGLRADLVLVDANPLEDVTNLGGISGVMVRGRWLPADSLQLRLEALTVAQAARSLAAQGKIVEALQEVERADRMVSSDGTPASVLAEVCQRGVVLGYASDVLGACDRAVSMEAGQTPRWRSDRGIARAITGDTDGAIKDFEFFIEQVEERYRQAADMRREWINSLRDGENPFTDAFFEKLRSRSAGS
jgi:hypothetical protein